VYVGIQGLLFVAYFLPIQLDILHLPYWVRYSGLVILGLGVVLGLVALLQLNTNLSPFPTPVSNGKLITNGAYAIARHPIYTAIFLAGIGYALFSVSIYKVLLCMVLLVLFYFKSNYEEALLSQKFPAYKAYKERTRRFI